MAGHKFVFVLLLVFGAVASILLVPGEDEMGLVYYKEHRYQEAERLYARLYQRGAMGRGDLVALARIYIAEGDVDKAISTYEEYLARNPSDMEVWEKVAQLYRDAQRPYDEMRALEKIVEQRPTLERWEKLADLYNRYGESHNEVAVLQRLVELEADDRRNLYRLIRLQAGHGDLQAAAAAADLYEARFPKTVNAELAELRLRLLISSGRLDDAFSWARKWLDTHPEVAVRYTAILYSGGASTNTGTAFERAAAVDPTEMPAWLIGAVMEAAWERNKQAFLEQFAGRLNAAQKKAYPVLMAGIALRKGDDAMLHEWLRIADSRDDLSVRQRLNLAAILLELEDNGKAVALMRELAEETAEATKGLVRLVPRLLKSHAEREGFEVFDQLRRRGGGGEAEDAWAILAAALGKRADLVTWLDTPRGEQASYRLLEDIYYAAADRGHKEAALPVARRLYFRFRQKEDGVRLANALLAVKKADEALPILRPYKDDTDDKLRRLWESALVAAWEQNAPVRDEVLTLWKRKLKASKLSRKKRRAIAYQLLAAGDKKAAMQEFLRLAEREGPEGKDVQQLLFLWGPLPGNDALDWLERRARKAPSSQLAGWWRHLIQAGGSDRVLRMAAEMGVELDAEAEDALMAAMADSGDWQALDYQLIARSETENDPERLERLARKAGLQGRDKAAERIWRRLHDIDPNHLQALRALGIAAFYREDRTRARQYLSQYLASSKGDWESAFYLGEVLFAEGQEQKARSYYARSLRKIEVAEEPTRRQRLARAQMLRHMGRPQDAIAAFDRLLSEYPNDVDIRAEYAALLVDEGQLEQAQRLLKENRQ